MGRIGISLSGIERSLLNRLAEANAAATLSALRMATGNKINSPRDDPSAFLTLSGFQSRLGQVRATMTNVTAASSRVTQAQSVVSQIRTELEAIRTELLTDEGRALGSQSARDAAQAKIDTAIGQVNTLATSEIDGRRLLDGSAAFRDSGRNVSQVRDLVVHSTGGAGPVVAAKKAELTYTGTSRYARFDATIELTGSTGSTTVAVTADDTLESIAQTINDRTQTTGVTASVDDNTLTVASQGARSGEFVTMQITGGTLIHSEATGTLTSNATFDLTGNGGAAHNFAFTAGQSLQDVADAINLETGTTNVTATLDGNSILLQSTDSSDTGSVTIDNVTVGTFAGVGVGESQTATGGRSNQTDAAVPAVYGSTPAISGTVLQASTGAQLVYTGDASNQTTSAAVFTLAGRLGSTSITVANAEALSSVADKINDYSHATGITATVDGVAHTLTLATVDYGSSASIAVTVSSGTFDVTGGNGDGTAQGTNAVAEINAITYSGNAVAQPGELRHREKNTGSFAADATIRVTGYTQVSADIAILTTDSLQDIADDIAAESGTTGVTAEVDGNDLVLYSTIDGAGGAVDLEVLGGAFDTVTDYTPATQAELVYAGDAAGKIVANADFTLTGDVGSQLNVVVNVGESLAAAALTINGFVATTGVAATVEGNNLILRSVNTGTAASVAVTDVVGSFDVTGGNGDGTANGTNATASADGVDAVTNQPTVDGNRFTVNQGGFHYQIEFAAGFSGDFDAITLHGEALPFALTTDVARRSTLAIQGLQAAQLGGISGTLDQLASGGALSGLDGNTSAAIRVVDEGLADLTRVEAAVDGFYNASITSASNLMSDLEDDLEAAVDDVNLVNDVEESVRQSYYLDLASNAAAGLAILSYQRSSIVALIQQIAGLA